MDEPAELKSWLARAFAYTATLPPKKKKARAGATKPPAKKPAAKKAPAKPAKKKTSKKPTANGKPNTGLMCRTCGTRDLIVSSQAVRRIREGKRILMANCRCKNGHEFQSRHPEAIKASREADKQKVATVTLLDGKIIEPHGGWAAARAREAEEKKARQRSVSTGTNAALPSSFREHIADALDDAFTSVDDTNPNAVEFDEEDEDTGNDDAFAREEEREELIDLEPDEDDVDADDPETST